MPRLFGLNKLVQAADIQPGTITSNEIAPGTIPPPVDVESELSGLVDDSTLELVGSSLRIKDGGVNFQKMAGRPFTTNGSDPGVGGVSISNSSGTFFTSTTARTTVPNLQTTLTTTGKLVHIRLIPDQNAGVFPRWGFRMSGATNTPGNTCYFVNVGTGGDIARTGGNFRNDTGGNIESYAALGGFGLWANLPAGVLTVRIDAQFTSGAGVHTILCQHLRLLMFEQT